VIAWISSPDYDVSDEREYGINRFAWILLQALLGLV
jgi:hypothetical protein